MLPQRVYKFFYNNKSGETRIVLPLTLESGWTTHKVSIVCHDFVRRDIRKFLWEKIEGDVEDVTDKCLVKASLSDKERKFYENTGLSLFDIDEKTFIVKA